MVEWLAGKRMKGTSSERTTTYTPQVGGWVELGRTTLGSSNTDITVSSLTNKRYHMILAHSAGYGSAVSNFGFRFNSDIGNTYASRQQGNGGTDGLFPSQNRIQMDKSAVGDSGCFVVGYTANYSSKEKLTSLHTLEGGGTGAGVVPVSRKELAGKWDNISNPISSMTWTNYQGTDTFPSGTEMIILGYDPTDTHSNNFWTELDSVNGSGTSGALTSNTFTAKKYLWIQAFLDKTTSVGTDDVITMGNGSIDNGYNYSGRRRVNGNAEETLPSIDYILSTGGSSSGTKLFLNMFIVNVSTKEKLVMGHWNFGSTGAVAPSRSEFAGKWANTTNQANKIRIGYSPTPNTYGTSSIMKIWGSD